MTFLQSCRARMKIIQKQRRIKLKKIVKDCEKKAWSNLARKQATRGGRKKRKLTKSLTLSVS